MTLLTPQLLLGAGSGTDATDYTTASTTPSSGARILVAVVSALSGGGAETPTEVSHATMGQLTKVLEIPIPNNNVRLSIWTGVGSGSAGAFTIKHSGVMGNCLWMVVQQRSDVATPNIRQTATLANASSGSQGATLTASALSTSIVFGFFGYNSTSDVPTVGSGFTGMGSRVTQTSPVAALWGEYDNTSPPTQAPFTFGGTTGKALATIEIEDGSAAIDSDCTWWDGTSEIPVNVTWWDGTNEIPVNVL